MREGKRKRIEKAIETWKKDKPLLEAEQDIIQDKKDVKNKNKISKQGLTMTKRLMLFLFISCTIIQIFTLAATAYGISKGVYDFSALQLLITAVVGEVVAFAIYAVKSVKENTQGGIIYESAKWDNGIKEILQECHQEVKG